MKKSGGFRILSMDEQELQELMARVKAGDEAAFTRIVGHFKDRIVNYVYQLLGDYERAVEIAQETFVRVYFKADKYRPIAPLGSWVYAIASNLAKTDMRRSRKLMTVPLEEVKNDLAAGTYTGSKKDCGLKRNLRQAMDALSPRYRVPIILKDVEGYSQEEIAAIVKAPVGTVKARISRGRHLLKRALDKAANTSDGRLLSKEFENGRA
jgi:RNA polymerase sigma-70 factor (ECF subfamily)